MMTPCAQRRPTHCGFRALSPAVLRGVQAAILCGLLLAAAAGVSWWQWLGNSSQWEYVISFSAGRQPDGNQHPTKTAAEERSAKRPQVADAGTRRGWTLRIAATGGAVPSAVQCSYERSLRRHVAATELEASYPAYVWAAAAWLLTLVACVRWSTHRR